MMKGLLKGILAMVLIVLPVHDCCGEMRSIREWTHQENTRLEWNQTHEAYGRTVQVDIPVILPDVDRFPIIQVSAWMGSKVAKNLELPKAPDQTNAGIGIFYPDGLPRMKDSFTLLPSPGMGFHLRMPYRF